MTWDAIIVGAGAAGLLAAARAAELGRRVLLLEKNRKPGVKILMSGGTRCNLTQATDSKGIVKAFGKPGRFLHSALAALSPEGLVQLVEQEGVATKREETGKIFPASDRAVDILNAFLARLKRSPAELHLNEAVVAIASHESGFEVLTDQATYRTSRLMLTTGGQSYPGCGTTGDGYVWAKQLGHRIIPPRPALTPLKVDTEWVADLRGVTLPDVALKLGPCGQPLTRRNKPLAVEQGSFLFAHFGVSGPAALNLSRVVSERAGSMKLSLFCDFAPRQSDDLLQEHWAREAAHNGKAQAITLATHWLPRRLLEALWRQANVPLERKVAELGRQERGALTAALKRTELPVRGVMGFAKAEVTAGGVALDEVDSSTMRSKIVPALSFAGEILDLDGPIGGYNFQAAFSTGWLAATNL